MATNGYGNPMIVLLALLASLNARTALAVDANAAALEEFGARVRQYRTQLEAALPALEPKADRAAIAIHGRRLILHDVRANLVMDVLPDALP